MAVTVLLFDNINILTAMTPGIIMIIAFSDVIHLCSSYHMEISKGEQKEQAIEKSCSEVGAACLFTSITTFFGFISMALFPAPVSRQLGVALGVGVGLSLIIAMTLTPIIFSLMKAPKPLRVGAASKAQLLLYRVTDFIVHLTRNRPWIIIATFAVILVFTVLGVTRIKFETDITMRLAKDNSFRADARYFAKYFDGTNYVDVFLKSSEPGGILKPDLLSRVSAYQKRLTQFPEVDKVISLVNILNRLHRLFHPPDAEGRVPPMTGGDIRKYLFLLKMSGDENLNSLLDKDATTMRIRLHLNESGFVTAHNVSQRVQNAGQAVLGDAVQIDVTGITALLSPVRKTG
jgi:predicted RND superfamily exporter protein